MASIDHTELERLQAKNEHYNQAAPSWDWSTTLQEGKLSVAETRKKWIPKTTREEDGDSGKKQYDKRIKITQYAPITPGLVTRILGAVWQTEPTRELPKTGDLDQFVARCTRNMVRKESLGSVSRQALENVLWHDYCLALLDRRATNEPHHTKADDKRLGLEWPYVTLFHPTQVFDWTFNEDGDLDYVKLVTQRRERPNVVVTEYREVEADKVVWSTHRKSDETETLSTKTVELEGPLAEAGLLPVVVCNINRTDGLRGRSPLRGALSAELNAMLLAADYRWDLHLSSHPHLVTWTERMLGDIQPDSSTYTKLKPGRDSEPAEDMKWVEIAGAGLKEQAEAYKDARASIYSQAEVDPKGALGNPATGDAPSGVTVAYQFTTNEARLLTAVAEAADLFETEVLRLVAIDKGILKFEEADEQINTLYSKDFGLKSQQSMQHDVSWSRMENGPEATITKIARKKANLAIAGNVDQATKEKIITESEKGYDPPRPEFGDEE